MKSYCINIYIYIYREWPKINKLYDFYNEVKFSKSYEICSENRKYIKHNKDVLTIL